MKRIILLLMILLAVAGCAKDLPQTEIDMPSPSEPGQSDELQIPDQMPNFEIDEGVVTSEDTDGDGVDDKDTITFERYEVAEGVTLQRSMEVVEGEGATIILDFEGSSDNYSHIETIPKGIVADVSQIEFSVEPDFIVNPDPSVGWWNNITKRIAGPLKLKIGFDAFMGGESGAIVSAMESFNEIKLVTAMERCKHTELSSKTMVDGLCVMDVIGKYRDSFEVDDCEALYMRSDGGALMYACRAVILGDMSECGKVTAYEEFISLGSGFSYMLKSSKEENEKDCRGDVMLMDVANCLRRGISIEDKDACFHAVAAKHNNAGICKKIEGHTEYWYCITEITQDDSNCGEIFEQEDKVTCCTFIKDEAQRSRCIDYYQNDTEEDLGDFTISVDPYDVPLLTGKKYNFSFNFGNEARYRYKWSMDSTEYTSYRPFITKQFFPAGEGSLRVTAFNPETNADLAETEIEFVVDYPYSDRDLLNMTDRFWFEVCFNATRMYEGQTSFYPSYHCISMSSDYLTPLVWQGRTFNIHFEKEPTDSSPYTVIYDYEGAVSEDGKTLVYAEGSRSSQEEGTTKYIKHSVRLQGVPLEMTTAYQPTFDRMDHATFVGAVKGAKAKDYVTKWDYYERYPQPQGKPDQEIHLGDVEWNDQTLVFVRFWQDGKYIQFDETPEYFQRN